MFHPKHNFPDQGGVGATKKHLVTIATELHRAWLSRLGWNGAPSTTKVETAQLSRPRRRGYKPENTYLKFRNQGEYGVTFASTVKTVRPRNNSSQPPRTTPRRCDFRKQHGDSLAKKKSFAAFATELETEFKSTSVANVSRIFTWVAPGRVNIKWGNLEIWTWVTKVTSGVAKVSN